jgi:hypothetical protein
MITTPTRPVSTGAIPGVDPGITGGLAFLFPTGALEVGDIPVVAGDQVEALGWTARDLFGLDKPAEKPHPSYSRLSRYDKTGLIWLLQGRPVVALTEATAAIQSSTGAITIYRRHNKPAVGPVGDSWTIALHSHQASVDEPAQSSLELRPGGWGDGCAK